MLSVREWRITALLAEGLTNREIAVRIGSTVNTTKNYLRVIYDKTGMSSRLELALWHVKHEEDYETTENHVIQPTDLCGGNGYRAIAAWHPVHLD